MPFLALAVSLYFVLSGWGGRQRGADVVKIEERKVLIINCIYFAILLAAAFVILKYDLPMVTPFVTAFVIVYPLKGPICFLSGRLHLNRKVTVILLVLLFYSTAGPLIALLCIRMFSQGKALIINLPVVYTNRAEPILTGIFSSVEQSILRMDPSLMDALEKLEEHFVQSAGQAVSELFVSAMGWISGFASSLPGLLINLLLMVIATFFTAMGYDQLTSFCLLQMEEKSRGAFLRIQAHVVGALFVCIRSYALIMSITFMELALGLTLISVERSLLIVFLTAVFNVLPVLEIGDIMIPWMIITTITGDHKLALGLPIVYLAVTVIRNIIESKIIGDQIGLHPMVTLVSMFAGTQLFGVFGLFGLPTGLSLLHHLNDTDTIRLFRTT